MSRYIDADKLVERLKFKRNTDNIDRNKYAGLECAIAQCNKAPTADVVEVRHGEWQEYHVSGKSYGQVYYQHKDCRVNETQLFPSPYEFCPRCGAKMDGERREQNEG